MIRIEALWLSVAPLDMRAGMDTLLAQVVRATTPLPATISPFWITIATIMGVTVGMMAGIYPASRASLLDPVVALRQE